MKTTANQQRDPCSRYSIVHITGTHASVQAAKLRVYETLDKVGGRPGLNHTAEFAVEQQWVGLLVGTRGTGIREVEAASGAKVSISQETKEMGYSVVRITGSEQQITHASELINKKLELVNPMAASAALDAAEKAAARSKLAKVEAAVTPLAGPSLGQRGMRGAVSDFAGQLAQEERWGERPEEVAAVSLDGEGAALKRLGRHLVRGN
eukprot:CAMPEP_0171067194 /NCGR_PEP_ID=MMETSP0766_2-20121228/7858_1 /TAXON_ID=439317 /ORGANISM="Gambierdiscus australes, Strain CAWD 149" /LENGTH=207 /DNA_ID=CAMNT_0011523413 /DNA_START=6 /DNA_END=631 /DNA_ORIENTATION=-